MKYQAAAGDVVFCVAPVLDHLPGRFYEVEEGEEDFYSVHAVFETEKHLPHWYVVYALDGTILEEDA